MIKSVTLNNFLFKTYGHGAVLEPNLDGISLPDIRMSGDDFSGRDGGYVSSQFFSRREIVIRATLTGSCSEIESLKCSLQNSLPIRQPLPLVIETKSGNKYYTDTFLADIDMPEYGGLQRAVITLIAPSPYFYGGSSSDPSEWIEREISKIVGGGYETPYELPVSWKPGSTPENVINTGSIAVYPQIVLQGKWTNPVIRNTTTGSYIELNISTTNGDEIIIDMDNRTVTLNGGSILPFVVAGSSWWALQVGDNYIYIESDSGDDEQTGTVRYRRTYTSVYDGVCHGSS